MDAAACVSLSSIHDVKQRGGKPPNSYPNRAKYPSIRQRRFDWLNPLVQRGDVDNQRRNPCQHLFVTSTQWRLKELTKAHTGLNKSKSAAKQFIGLDQ